MNGFAARAALVSLWITIGSMGLMIMGMGGMNMWAAVKVGKAVGAMSGMGAAKPALIAIGLAMFLNR